MLLIVGLGNPGTKYKNTRHNIGFMAVDRVAEAHSIKCSKVDFKSQWGKGVIEGKDVILVKPQTFMNLSGVAVNAMSEYFSLELKDILVIYDDVDLNLGSIRIRLRGGSGGHKGLESIIEHLGTSNFPRIRLGIGRPKDKMQGDVADYVLSSFKSDEKDVLEQILNTASEAVEAILKHGIEKAMNKYNKAGDRR